MEHEDAFLAVVDAVLSKKRPSTFEHEHVGPPTSDQIFGYDTINCIQLSVEEAMTKLVPEILTAKHKGADNGLLVVPKSLIERIVLKVVMSAQTIPTSRKRSLITLDLSTQKPASANENNGNALVIELISSNTAYNAFRLQLNSTPLPTVACRRLAKTAHHYLRGRQNQSEGTLDGNVAHLQSALQPKNSQHMHVDKQPKDTYRTRKNKRFEQLRDAPSLTVIRTVN